MKSIATSIAASSLLAALAISQPAPRYTITDLVTLGGTFNQATFLNNHGLVTGLASLPDSATQHAVLWYKDRIMDIAKPGPGGLNSGAVGVNKLGQVELQAETSTALDPSGEDFCGYGTHRVCLPFVWQNGVITQLLNVQLAGEEAVHPERHDERLQPVAQELFPSLSLDAEWAARAWLDANVPRSPLASFDTEAGFEQHRAWERALAGAA